MAKTKKFSKHISWKEAIGSATAKKLDIDNTPNEEQLNNMKNLAEDLFEPLREKVGEPILINSFFRCEELNKAISGSATTSQHIKGCAIDLDATKMTNCELFYIIKNYFEFDKLIWELGDDENPAWIHVSYVKGKNRGLVYQAKRKPGKGYTTYHIFTLDQIEDE
jgi:zinc D-Ala-D-Ala carboxypeptidase